MAFIQCTAKSKGTGQQCRRAVTPGSTKCYYHGGRSRAGAASATFKHGRYSKYTPAGLLGDRYRAALADPDLLVLRDDIAANTAIIADLLENKIEGTELRRDIISHWQALMEAITQQNKGSQARHVAALDDLINRLQTDGAARAELLQLMDSKRRLTDSERKRITAAATAISADQMLTVINVMLATIRDSVNRHAPANAGKILADLSVQFKKLAEP